jgi:ArsR family transcriptional regulator
MTNQEFLTNMKVLNDETRLNIIQILSQNGTMCACKILEELHITQGTLSHHMKVLTTAGLVTFTRDGKYCNYSFVKEPVCELTQFLKGICANVNLSENSSCHITKKCS